MFDRLVRQAVRLLIILVILVIAFIALHVVAGEIGAPLPDVAPGTKQATSVVEVLGVVLIAACFIVGGLARGGETFSRATRVCGQIGHDRGGGVEFVRRTSILGGSSAEHRGRHGTSGRIRPRGVWE